MTVTQARDTLQGFGYSVIGYQAMGNPRRYLVCREPLAEFCGLPAGGTFDKDGLKAFVGQVTAEVEG